MPPKLSLEDAKRTAEARGGICLSPEYDNCRSRLQWRCREGHVWAAAYFAVRAGNWCPTCAIAGRAAAKKNTIDRARQLAASKGGLCLEEAYKHNKAAMRWRCAANHEWRASFNHVDRGRWCPTCANLTKADALRVHDIGVAQRLASARGGLCLSDVYTNCTTKLDWQCSEGHVWKAPFSKVKDSGHWCPECPAWKREAECRALFEELTGKRFPPLRPTFLQGLAYDGYCEELRVAFEHNGRQHYEDVPFFHQTEGALEDQQDRDRLKTSKIGTG